MNLIQSTYPNSIDSLNSSPPIRLSIALVTRNRPDSLERTLSSLRGQSVQPFEVVVSDDSDPASTLPTQAIAERYRCRYLPGPRRGLYANRNHAARNCSGTHVRTMDDDHTFPAHHLEHCLRALAQDPQAIWTTGETSFLDGQFYSTAWAANQLHPSGAGCRVLDPDDNWAIADGSTIYPNQIFQQGFFMIEDFNYGASYLEFGAYLYSRGLRCRCLPHLQVEHHLNPDTLRRKDDPEVILSYLFASLCYNLHFKPNLLRAARYVLAALRRHPQQLALIRSLPALREKARQRWRTVPATTAPTFTSHTDRQLSAA